MDLLILVTTSASGPILTHMARACTRAGIDWSVFFTNDGVKTLLESDVTDALAGSGQSIACQDSWNHWLPGRNCPVELGSQTGNSSMLSETQRIISL